MSATPKSEFRQILRTLANHRVEFLVVEGISAVLQGAPLTTFDLDVVHSRSATNVERLLAALEELDAVYRSQQERRLRPGSTHLASAGHQLLIMKFGPLDVLGAVGDSRVYEDLAGEAVSLEVDEGLSVPVLRLEALIRTKEETGRPQDLAALPVLRKTLEQIRRR